MRTVPTICASGAGIGLAIAGLTVVREETSGEHHPSRDTTPSNPEMTTAVAGYPQTNFDTYFGHTTPSSARSASGGQNGKARSGEARIGQKRTLTPRTSMSMAMDGRRGREDGDESTSKPSTPNTQPHSWLQRLSSTVSTSRESSSTPASRPGSAAVSYSNGSVAFSHAGSTTPIFPNNTPAPLPPNKLVKRTSSVRSTNSSPFQNSGSRLPIPVFRRPATSHQRSATLQERYSGSDQSDHMSIDEKSPGARDAQLQQYFTPKVAADEWSSARKRSSSGIPNPIKRIYPDRKYKPVLAPVNAGHKPAQAEFDDGLSFDEDSLEASKYKIENGAVATSSPILTSGTHFEEAQQPRRSFSIGDLLSTGPQPLWRRTSQSRGKTSGSRLVRRNRPRVVSAPQAAMGNALSTGNDTERPAKRREVTDPLAAQRSIYSSSSNNQRPDAQSNHEIELNLSNTTPHSQRYDASASPFAESPSQTLTSSPLDQNRLPSATVDSAGFKHVRVSAAQSEITSTVDSDSEYRSVGDASTDYQSDTPYDSFPTRTTRSSLGRRGPHIETIFDDSPPNYSSGRSTRLKDLLNEGAYQSAEYGTRYRHSTIEEEESIVSTPVRSLHDNSVQSTPSARPGAQQLFTSSPPAVQVMPDPDEIDWDAPDDEPSSNGLDTKDTSSSHVANLVVKSLPFRFGPALRETDTSSTNNTSARSNGTNQDRANLFDWAEVQPSPNHNTSPPRPRTVHGKKGQENRGSRPAGRRAPSGMHARSHSVPVVPDVDGNRNNVVANKFGTWGVGSKAITEDWNEDFDFDDLPAPAPEHLKEDAEKRVDSGHEMFVPRSIRDQQKNVMANIGLLREWGLLIEELKQLRVRAVALDLVNGTQAQAWQEVDAMIELADQETEELTLEPRRSPPSSPGFDYDAFDEPMPRLPNHSPPQAQADEPRDVPFEEAERPKTALRSSPPPITPQQNVSSRPRKDSEAVARSVIEALQSRRSISDPTALKQVPPSKKVPFDTATLRHIVPYVKDLKRKVKDALREAEGLYSSPRRSNASKLQDCSGSDDEGDEPPFRSIFDGPHSPKMPSRRKSRRQEADTDHDGSEHAFIDQRGDLAQRMQNMNIPH